MPQMNRRQWLAGTAAAGLVAAGAGCEGMKRKGDMAAIKNADFYKADGTFDQDSAKQAYYDLMASFGYPQYESLKEQLWVLDFGLGRFTDVGMGGVFWLNEWDEDAKYGYLGHEIYLLPGQMIPEHWHVKHEAIQPKIEGWMCRYGQTILFGEGDASPEAKKIIPASEWEHTTVRHMTRVKPGECGKLNRPLARHSQVGGPDGAIVTEYASYHSMDALRFTNPNVKL
jgi:D-lyxose ketol-isomerase